MAVKNYIACLIVCMVLVSGCAYQQAGEGTEQNEQNLPDKEEIKEEALPQDSKVRESTSKGYTIALVMKALSNPFFANMEAGAREYATANGIPLEVFGVERETDVENQIGIVENLIARDYDAIVIAPADSIKLIPVCKKAIDAGIIVINIDNPFDNDALAENGVSIPFVGSDNSIGAGMVAEYMKEKLGRKGNVFVIEGIRGVRNADLRMQGFTEGIAKGTSTKVIESESANWHTDEAFAVVSNLLDKHGSVDGIFCANDNMALGALHALELHSLVGKVWLGAYDNIEAVRDAMAARRMHATIEQHPELMGAYGVELAAKALEGEKIPEYKATPLDLITYEVFGKKIGISIADLSNPFFESLYNSAKKDAGLFGAEMAVADAKNDDAQQWADIKKFVDDKVDIIIVNPTNTETISPAIELANDAKIPVITVDRSASGVGVASHIASDNKAGGRLAGEFIARSASANWKVLELEGIPGTSSAKERGLGFYEVIEKYPNIQLVKEVADFDREKAKITMERLLKSGESFDAVFAHNDNMILGVLDALEAANYEKPIVLVGFDAIPEAVSAVRQGRISATIAQKPADMGKMAVQAAVNLLRGKDTQPILLTGLELIED